MSLVTLAEVRTAALNKTTAVDDVEIQRMIDAAEADYAEKVGPLTTQTVRLDGGFSTLILPRNAATVTAVSYGDGTAVTLTDLYFDAKSGLLHAGKVSRFTYGTRNVLVTFTVALPAHHRETIIADVAGYFAATQRGNSGGALPGGYETAYEDRTTPVALFPRIKALAESYASIG